MFAILRSTLFRASSLRRSRLPITDRTTRAKPLLEVLM